MTDPEASDDALGMRTSPRHAWFALLEPGLLELTMPRETTEEAITEAFGELERWMFEEVDRPYAFLIRLDHVFALSSRQRRLIGDYERRYAEVELRFNAGQAVVIHSAVQRSIFAAFTWISPPVWPYRIFGDHDDALAHLRAHFRRVASDHPNGPLWTGRLRGAAASALTPP